MLLDTRAARKYNKRLSRSSTDEADLSGSTSDRVVTKTGRTHRMGSRRGRDHFVRIWGQQLCNVHVYTASEVTSTNYSAKANDATINFN